MDLSTSGLTTLAWEGHKPHLSEVFTRLQLHSSLVDVSLTCATGQTVRCHKVLLAAASPYFQKLFSESGAKVGFLSQSRSAPALAPSGAFWSPPIFSTPSFSCPKLDCQSFRTWWNMFTEGR